MHPTRNQVGNIFETPLNEIWNNSAYQQLRSGLNPICNNCANRLQMPFEQAVPIDDEFFRSTHKILDQYENKAFPIENVVGQDWDFLWSRWTSQLPLPKEWTFLRK